MFLYVLKLNTDKYYIGKSENVKTRIESHFIGEGSVWTKLYKPLELVETIETENPYDEDALTLLYMEKYGIDNVRGGQWCQISLSSEQKKYIHSSFTAGQDRCYKCNNTGHFSRNCKNIFKGDIAFSIDENDSGMKVEIDTDVENELDFVELEIDEPVVPSNWLYSNTDTENTINERVCNYRTRMLLSYSMGLFTGFATCFVIFIFSYDGYQIN